eukprot:jgi/Mesen1/6825/ME000035S06200
MPALPASHCSNDNDREKYDVSRELGEASVSSAAASAATSNLVAEGGDEGGGRGEEPPGQEPAAAVPSSVKGPLPDIEDLCAPEGTSGSGPGPGQDPSLSVRLGAGTGKDEVKQRPPLEKHRRRRGLAVTDITASEWCEKQVEFSLARGAPEATPAMLAGSSRHAELEAEVVEAVEVAVHTREDSWALRLIDSATRLRQLRLTGLAREVFVLGLVEGAWVVGVIDELRSGGGAAPAMLVDTKTRLRPTAPSYAQKQNSRLQLMVYKLLLDTMVGSGFPLDSFCTHFALRLEHRVSDEVCAYAASTGVLPLVETLADAAVALISECALHQQSHGSLLLRYEWQADRSLLGQDEFPHEPEWAAERLQWHLGYWQGLRAAEHVPEDELWKCRFCSFAASCSTGSAVQLHHQQQQQQRRREGSQGRKQAEGAEQGGGSESANSNGSGRGQGKGKGVEGNAAADSGNKRQGAPQRRAFWAKRAQVAASDGRGADKLEGKKDGSQPTLDKWFK